MASKRFAQSVCRFTTNTSVRVLTTVPRISHSQAWIQHRPSASSQRYLHTTQSKFADQPTTSKAAEAITTPPAEPTPDQETDPNKHSAYLGEADSNDGFEAFKDAHGDPPPSIDASNAAFLGEADSDDGFESRKDIEGQKFEAVDATNSAYLGEADSDDGFESHREAHPEDGDHKIVDPVESGLHGQSGEQDR